MSERDGIKRHPSITDGVTAKRQRAGSISGRLRYDVFSLFLHTLFDTNDN